MVLPFLVREDLGVMSMKGYSTFPKAPGLEPQHRIQSIFISEHSFGGDVLPAQMITAYFPA